MKKIYLGAGCFWGTQSLFDKFDGIIETTVGYANSKINNPSYEQVVSQSTNAIETCEIVYDENIICLDKILKIFFDIIDPSLINQQGNDKGTQYQSAIFYNNIKDKEYLLNWVSNNLNNIEVNTLIAKLDNYYLGESYHQKYLDKNPNGYCHINVSKYYSKYK